MINNKDRSKAIQTITYTQLKNAIIKGNASIVSWYLSQNCPLVDPLVDNGNPNEDGYNDTVLNSLLYEAVLNLKVLKILLTDGRFDPNEANHDAFYRCLYLGEIEGLKLFINDYRFIFPKNTLEKATELGGINLIKLLLDLDMASNKTLFSQSDWQSAENIAQQNNDVEIVNLIQKHMESAIYQRMEFNY